MEKQMVILWVVVSVMLAASQANAVLSWLSDNVTSDIGEKGVEEISPVVSEYHRCDVFIEGDSLTASGITDFTPFFTARQSPRSAGDCASNAGWWYFENDEYANQPILMTNWRNRRDVGTGPLGVDGHLLSAEHLWESCGR